MVNMGLDLIEVKDFLEDKGIHEENPEIVLDYLTDNRYTNSLKTAFEQSV